MTGRRPRVLLVGRAAPEQGGIAIFLEGLMTGPLAEYVELSLLNLTRPDERGQGGAFNIANLRRTLVDAWRVFRRAGDVDLVHLHSSLAPTPTMIRAGLLAAAARLRGRRVVVHAHGGRAISWLDGGRARTIARLSLASANSVIAVSETLATKLAEVFAADRIEFIANGIDLGGFTDVPDHDRPAHSNRVVYVGHLSRRKGLLDLRDAGRILRSRGVPHEIALVGGDPDEGSNERERLVDDLGDEVCLLGQVAHEHIPSILATARVFCLPSWWEAMPLSIIEAMAAGLPVVATNVGDVGQMVSHGETGLLVEPHQPEALADALESLLRDPERCEAMGAAARNRARNDFDGARTQRRIWEHYGPLLDLTPVTK